MTGSVSIDYRLGKNGWASFTLKVDEAKVDVGEFGYCTDALGDLLRAALTVVTGGTFATLSLDSEPAEWRILLGELWFGLPVSERLEIQVRTFPDMSDRLPDEKGTLVFHSKVGRDEFGRAVLSAAQSIWERYGADGYSEAWDFMFAQFPLRAMQALETALSTQEPFRSTGAV